MHIHNVVRVGDFHPGGQRLDPPGLQALEDLLAAPH